MKKLIFGIFMFGCMLSASAQELNDYKYIIIPETFEFTGEPDEYRLNSLTKFLFNKNGFNTLMLTEDKPGDLRSNRCLGLHTDLLNNSGLFVTKLVLQLKDCDGRIVFESQEGRSREKDYEKAFQEALRDAFTTIEELDYKYVEREVQNRRPAEKAETQPAVAEEPVQEKKELEQVAEVEVEEVAEAEMDKESTGNQKVFQYSGKNYELKETSQGLGLFQQTSPDPIAILIKTTGGENYIYNSLTNQGVAYFDEQGNLIVEYFSRTENKKLVLTYKLVD